MENNNQEIIIEHTLDAVTTNFPECLVVEEKPNEHVLYTISPSKIPFGLGASTAEDILQMQKDIRQLKIEVEALRNESNTEK